MADLTPHIPYRPLIWPDFVLDLQDKLDFDEPVYLVGGAVRDALWSQPIHDLDLTVASNGIALAKRIANHFNGDFFVLDAVRDVGRALVETDMGRLTIDVARFRGEDLAADLLDRDFTINAMAVNLSDDPNLLIDPLSGANDVKGKILRRCNEHSIESDPIRTLRAVRQSIQFNLRIEPETLADVRTYGQQLKEVSAERIRDELIKMLAMSKSAGALRVADALGLLKSCLPEAEDLHLAEFTALPHQNGWQHTLAVVENLSIIMSVFNPSRSDAPSSFSVGVMVMQLDRYRASLLEHFNHLWPNERPHRALLSLAAFLHDVGRASGQPEADWPALSAQIAQERAFELRLSKAEIDRLVVIVQNFPLALQVDTHSDLEIHRFWHRFGVAGIDMCFMGLADYLGSIGSEIEQASWLKVIEHVRVLLQNYFERYDEIVVPPQLIDGNQLMQRLDLKPGPIIGLLLDQIREAQVTGSVQTIDDAIKVARLHLPS